MTLVTPTDDFYRTRTIKRERRTKAAVTELDKQILAVLTDDHPQSVRHVFYRMTDPRLPEPVEKSERGYRHVQERMVRLRRTGRLPYSWITDATRRGYFTPTYRNAGDFLRRMAGLYRADLWQQSNWYVEVWTESRSIAGVIEDDCAEMAVSLYPAAGFSSLTLAFNAAEYINANSGGKRVCIFYVGDYDPAGVLIDVALERELRQHLRPEIVFYFHRLGITKQQVAKFDLPMKPRKTKDRRALHIETTVEAEAMPAHFLRAMLRDCIEQFLPAGALQAAKAAEESERAHLDHMSRLLGGGGSFP